MIVCYSQAQARYRSPFSRGVAFGVFFFSLPLPLYIKGQETFCFVGGMRVKCPSFRSFVSFFLKIKKKTKKNTVPGIYNNFGRPLLLSFTADRNMAEWGVLFLAITFFRVLYNVGGAGVDVLVRIFALDIMISRSSPGGLSDNEPSPHSRSHNLPFPCLLGPCSYFLPSSLRPDIRRNNGQAAQHTPQRPEISFKRGFLETSTVIESRIFYPVNLIICQRIVRGVGQA